MKKYISLCLLLAVSLFSKFPVSAQESRTIKYPLTLTEFIDSAKKMNMLQIRLGISLLNKSGGAEAILSSNKEPRDENFYKTKDALVIYMDAYLELLLSYKQSNFKEFKTVSQNALEKIILLKNIELDEDVQKSLDEMAEFYQELTAFANSKI